MKPRTASVMTKIANRAKRGQQHVEVEHLLLLVKLGDAGAAPTLRELAERHAWPMKKRGSVPLGAWAEAIATFLEKGPSVLAGAVKKKRIDGDVALGLLDDVHTAESLEACLALARIPALQRSALRAIQRIVGSEKVDLDAGLVSRVRSTVHRLLRPASNELERTMAYGILTRVGDEKSLALILSMPKTSPKSAFAGAQERAIASVKRRLAKKGR